MWRQKAESFGMGKVRRTESIWYPAIAMLSGVIELHPELKMIGKKIPDDLTSEATGIYIIIVKTFIFKASSHSPGYVQN